MFSRKSFRLWFALIVLGFFALAMAACQGDGEPAAQDTEETQPTEVAPDEESAEQESAEEPAEMRTIRLAYPTGRTTFANCDIRVGLEQGFFQEEGFDIETENLGSGLRVVQAIVSGDFDIGGASIEPVINAIAREQELSVIATYSDRLTVSMIVAPEIETVADLEGKQLGIQDIGAFREVMTRLVLQSGGLTPEDVNYVSVATPAYISGLLEGQIQSAVLHAEQVQSILSQDPNYNVLVDLYEVEPGYFYGTYFAFDSWLEENSDIAQGFVTAIVKAHRFMYENKDETVRICSEVTGFDEEIVAVAWDKYFTENNVFPVNSGLDVERIGYTIDRMVELGTLTGEPPAAEDIVDPQFMENTLSELGEEPERE